MRNSWIRAWIATAAVLVAASAIARSRHSTLLRAEEPVMNWLLDGTDVSGWERFGFFGSPWLVYPGTIILALIALKWSVRVALTVVLTMAFGLILNVITKAIVARPRPEAIVDTDGWAFPSTTVVQAGVFWGLVTLVVWWLGAPRLVVQIVLELAVVFTLVTGVSRVVAGYHWPSDVVGSAIVIALTMTTSAILFEGNQRTVPLFSRSTPANAT